jgi:hypothetical protein
MSVFLDPEQAQPFTPANADEYLALQLAKRLGDELKILSYVRYVEHYPAPQLAKLFHQAKRESDSANVFHSSLTQSQP